MQGSMLAGFVAVAAASHSQTSVGVLKVRLGGDARQTRVVIELDRPTRGRLITDGDAAAASGQPKVVLALAHMDVSGDMEGDGAGLVRSWSVNEAAGAAQVRLNLVRSAVVRRRFLLPPGDGLPVYRYVIDIGEAGGAETGGAETGRAETGGTVAARSGAARSGAPRAPVRISLPVQPLEPARKVIVIDAGHGGKDPGAAGPETGGESAHEKDITLAAARALRDRLERTGRYKVVMTRDTDDYIPLETRVMLTRRANADLFISLHADSGADPGLRGATVYTLSEQGADRADRQVFEKANWINVDLPGADDSVNRILLDLTQRQTRNRSAVFAETLLARIGDKALLQRRSHRDAGFMVLLAPDVPAVLLEMGFITNEEDEHELLDPRYRARLMEGVSEAIDSYFDHDHQIAQR